MTRMVFSTKRGWGWRAGAAVLWVGVCVLGVATHSNPIAIAANAVLALIFTYRAYLSYTTTHPRSPRTDSDS